MKRLNEPIIIINVLSRKGMALAKKFTAVGRGVIGVASPEAIRSCNFPIMNVDVFLVSPDLRSMACAASSSYDHCGIIEC